MGELNINTVTFMICIIMLIYLVKGITNKFSAYDMFSRAAGTINIILFAASLVISFFTMKEIILVLNTLNNGVYSSILANFMSNKGLLLPLIALVLFLTTFFILQYIRLQFDGLIKLISESICKAVKEMGKVNRIFIGILMEIPRFLVAITVFVMMLSFFNNYYPSNPLSLPSGESGVYKYIYSYSASPIINSSLGKSIPAFVINTMDDISTGISDSKISGKPNILTSLSYLRFQFECRSNVEIDSMAKKITINEKTDRGKAYAIYKWIGSNIDYDWGKYNNILDNKNKDDKFGAIAAYTARKGICEDYSDLFVAMARAAGLKVRVVVGQGYSSGNWVGHAWNEVYISEENKWIFLDTTWAMSGNYFDNANFVRDHVFEAVAGEW